MSELATKRMKEAILWESLKADTCEYEFKANNRGYSFHIKETVENGERSVIEVDVYDDGVEDADLAFEETLEYDNMDDVIFDIYHYKE